MGMMDCPFELGYRVFAPKLSSSATNMLPYGRCPHECKCSEAVKVICSNLDMKIGSNPD